MIVIEAIPYEGSKQKSNIIKEIKNKDPQIRLEINNNLIIVTKYYTNKN